MSSLAVSLDLDEVFRHLAIHGRPPSSTPGRGSARGAAPPEDRAAFHFGLPRALAWARSLELPLTLFAVAEDTRDPFVAAALRRAAGDGHPVESHSTTHPYDLVRRSVAEQRAEIAGSVDELEATLGVRPEGFRAPGYLVDDGVLDRVEEAGLLFDASILPCPAYFAAKVTVLAGLALRGRRSASLPRGGRMAFAPRRPYRPGRPFDRAGDRSLVELPVSVSRRLRLPAIGTFVGAMTPSLARVFARSFAQDPLVSLELHAMDFLASDDPGVGSLRGAQPELGRSVGARANALSAFVGELLRLGFRPTTLREAARGFQATLPPGSMSAKRRFEARGPLPPGAEEDDHIFVDKVEKSFGKSRVIKGITMHLKRERTAVIIGGSGAGKTTLLRMLIGLEKPSSGRIWVDGVDIAPLGDVQMNVVRQKFGMVFQYAALLDSLNVFDNVAFPLREHRKRMSHKEVRDKVLSMLESLGLGGKHLNMPSELSGGQRKRVGLARALMLEPEILVYDEPTSGLDPLTSRMVDDLIEETRERYGVTSVVISHDMASTFRIAHHAYLLVGGLVVASGPPDQLAHGDNEVARQFIIASGVATERLSRVDKAAPAAVEDPPTLVHRGAAGDGPGGTA